MEKTYFYLFHPLNTIWVLHINKHKTLKGREKANQLRALAPEKQHSDKFLGLFVFCFVLPHTSRLDTGEAGNPQTPTDADRKRSKKSLLSLAKGSIKG